MRCAYGSPLGPAAGGFPVAVQLPPATATWPRSFRLGGQLERARPWFNYTPPLAS